MKQPFFLLSSLKIILSFVEIFKENKASPTEHDIIRANHGYIKRKVQGNMKKMERAESLHLVNGATLMASTDCRGSERKKKKTLV